MPAQTLLEINPDDLFANHTISEIKAIDIQIQNEIEKKKEELRTMVGEKCRDLLNAADTISEMKETAENFMAVISHTKQLCQALQDKRSQGFQPLTVTVAKKPMKTSEEISKVIEMKILLILPEHIWSAIDNKDYLLGAQFFLFATHLHLGLNVCSNAQSIANKYPVLQKQWEIISSSKKTIVDGACRELANISITPQKAAECLCSLIFLEIRSYEKILNHFLDIRMSALNSILKSEELSRKKLGQCVELLQQTLVIIFICFFENQRKKCLIEEVLNSVSGNERPPTLSKIMQVSLLPEQHLSSVVLNFRPKASSHLNILTQEHIRKASCEWLDRVEALLRLELTKILLLIEDIKRMHKIIKQEVLNVEYPKNWEEIIHSLLGVSQLNLYQKFIKGYVTNRIRDLIQITWQNSLNKVSVLLNQADEEILKDRGKFPENDLRWFVWKESKIDGENGLKLKTLGYTPRVMDLCRKMNSYLIELLDDVVLYIGENTFFKCKLDDDSDANVILPFLNSYSLEMIQRFTRFVVDSCNADEKNESKIIIRARFLACLTSQSPGLQKCLRLNIQHEENFNESDSNKIWQEAVVCLSNGSNQIWQIWRGLVSSKLSSLVRNKLSTTLSIGSLLKSKLLSELITIEEQTEDGTSVKSDLRVPSQPSFSLQELLFQICLELNTVAPHTIPRQIHQDLVDSFVKDILEHYEGWSKSEIIYQSQSWQMLLDVKFVTLLLVTKKNKDISESICESLEKTIDPFDLGVYFPHLQNSVKKSTQKLQGTFGVLVDFSEKLPVFNGLKLSQPVSPSKLEEPNLLATSSNVPWFPLLPVTNPGLRKQETSRFESSDVTRGFPSERPDSRGKDKKNNKESVTSDFLKSAGAFFDAMTGGWT